MGIKIIVRWLTLTLPLSIAVSLGTAGDASACGDEWVPILEVDPRIVGVAQAEQALSDGNALAAAGSVIRMMPHIEQLADSADPLALRSQRVLAVALARGDGRLRLEREVPEHVRGHWAGRTPAAREKNLDFSLKVLRKQALDTEDPGRQTELAEALSRRESGRAEAREILERLARQDLVATPDGYAVLANLRARAGDRSGEQAALVRCRAMSGKSDRCSLALG